MISFPIRRAAKAAAFASLVLPFAGLAKVGVTSAATAPASNAPAGPPTRPATSPAVDRATLPAGDPILQLWSDGVYLLNAKPSLRFALWADGTMLQRVNGQTYRGRLRPSEVEALLQRVRDAGLFEPPLVDQHVRPDGGSQTVAARDGDRHVHLRYDGIYDTPEGLAQTGPHSLTARADASRLLRRWHGTLNAIRKLAPERLDRVDGEPPLAYPATRPG